MNQYETVFILTPVLSDEQMKETAAKFKKVLTDKGAEVLSEEAWGLKKMAYAIQKKSTGFYCLIEFKAEPEVMSTLRSVATNLAQKQRRLNYGSTGHRNPLFECSFYRHEEEEVLPLQEEWYQVYRLQGSRVP